MRAEQLTVQLRPRSPWEAVELGTALVRRHGRAIWPSWLLASLLVLVPLNLACWALGKPWLAGVLAWWLKPVFDRIPLYVISRGVFGEHPSSAQTLRAQLRWGWRSMAGQLLWRRLSPARSLMLPIELLEGERGPRLRMRRRVLAGPVYGNALMLTMVCIGFSWALSAALLVSVLTFVPQDYLPEVARSGWALLSQPPPWAQLVLNLACWAGTGVVEPFYVGAGFGLYLNRRTQIEAWDVEIAFRRMAARLRALAAPLAAALVLTLLLPAPWLHAQGAAAAPTHPAGAPQADGQDAAGAGQDRPQAEAQDQAGDEDAADDEDEDEDGDGGKDERTVPGSVATAQQVFGNRQVDAGRFQRAAARAWKEPQLNRTRTQTHWEAIAGNAPPRKPPPALAWLAKLQPLLAFLGEWGLWIIAAAVLGLLLATAPRWWPWMRGVGRVRKAPVVPVQTTVLELPEALPDDIAGSARALWRQGQPRRALALLYRASVEAMAQRAGVSLPPGATEAQCLRASRRQPQEADRSLFARMVQVWQYAAYARQLPDAEAFDALLGQLQERYGWAR